MASEFHNAVESIQQRLRTSGTDANAIERCGPELSQLGSAVTSQIETEFNRLADAAEPSAA